MSARRRAWRRGRWAETLCVWYLRLCGYRILARDFRVPVGEIDIVARRGSVLVMVEVKARTSRSDGASAILARQRSRIRRAAEAFLVRNPQLAHLDVRFDAMLVAPRAWPSHIADAWRE